MIECLIGVCIGLMTALLYDLILDWHNNRGGGMNIIVRKKKTWYFIITAKNNKILATSESYATKGNAVKAARNFMLDTALVGFEMEIQHGKKKSK